MDWIGLDPTRSLVLAVLISCSRFSMEVKFYWNFGKLYYARDDMQQVLKKNTWQSAKEKYLAGKGVENKLELFKLKILVESFDGLINVNGSGTLANCIINARDNMQQVLKKNRK